VEDAQANLDIADVALPFMRSLVERIHLTVHLAVLDQSEAVYIEKVERPDFSRLTTWWGRRMFCIHERREMLAGLVPRHDVEAIAKQHGLKKRTRRPSPACQTASPTWST